MGFTTLRKIKTSDIVIHNSIKKKKSNEEGVVQLEEEVRILLGRKQR